ncbi:MAG: DUF11 domain-containing protein, partial [Chloroflexi bacterium]|nr:DUF11 domain-containing protein [Chloroflexota bacterium]
MPSGTTAGSTIAYSFLVTNTGNVTLTGIVVNDPLLAVAPTCPVTTLAPGASTTCTGTHTITQAEVNAGVVNNSATATGNAPGGGTTTSPPSTISTPLVTAASLTVVKTAGAPSGNTVGSTIAYTFLVTNTGNVTLTSVSVNDALLAVAPTCPVTTLAPGASTTCTGTHTIPQANLDAGVVNNSATTTGTVPGGGTTTSPPSTTTTPVTARPAIAVSKTATLTTDGGTPGVGNSGDVITYAVTVTNTGNVTLGNLSVLDSFQGGAPSTLSCAPVTLAPRAVAICASYSHIITVAEANAGGSLENRATATARALAGTITVTGTGSAVVAVEPNQVVLRLSKVAGQREVRIGDLVRYTLTLENTGDSNLVNGSVVDTPAAGFSYVEGSLVAVDGDNMATVSGQSPLRFQGLDIVAGGRATLVYLMRVGAGVRPGVLVNQAQAFSPGNVAISNVATAEVILVGDAMVDESLVFGTVFDDRDGDGWQDSAALSGVRVQGGFAASAYVPNSTTLDRGAGPQPLADASSPLLHGIDVGSISSRQSVADPANAHQLVIRQRLSELAFTDDFVLTSAQGVTVTMDAAGSTTLQKSGEAGKGLNAAEPSVERRVALAEGGYAVDYVVSNLGIDERGIPGVRIASVEGLLMETDQFGRFHLAGVPSGAWERGRNFILKVDPSTLPSG